MRYCRMQFWYFLMSRNRTDRERRDSSHSSEGYSHPGKLRCCAGSPPGIIYPRSGKSTGPIGSSADASLSTERQHAEQKNANGTDEENFYQYDLQWSPSLEPLAIKQAGTENVTTLDFLGKRYPGELRFSSRKLLAGPYRMLETEPLSFKEDCKQLAYRYTYVIDSTHALARIAGLNSFLKFSWSVTTTVSYN